MNFQKLLECFVKIVQHIEYDPHNLDAPWKKTLHTSNQDFSKLKLYKDRDVYIFSKFIYDNFYHEEKTNSFSFVLGSKNSKTVGFISDYWKAAESFVSAEFDRKWLVTKIYDGGIVQIRKNLISIATMVFEPEDPTLQLTVSSFVKKYFPPNYTINEGEHDKFFGNFSPDDDDNVVRFYWSVSPISSIEPVVTFLKNVLQTLNERKVIFSIKLESHEYRFPDNIVLYVDKRCYLNVQCVLHKLDRQLEHIADGPVPIFTHQLNSGLAFAEEPINFGINPSFGESRCWEIANFLLRNKKAINSIEKCFEKYLKKRKYDINRFYLNPKSTFVFKDPFLSSFPKITTPISFTDNKHLNISTNIGFHLCNAAIWYSNSECTWTKMVVDSNNEKKYITTCNSSFFDGTAGIALYLLKLFQYNPDELFYKTAIGALENAITLNQSNSIIGLHQGKAGLIFILVQCLEILKTINELPDKENLIEKYENNLYNIVACFPKTLTLKNYSIKDGLAGIQIVCNYLKNYNLTSNNVKKIDLIDNSDTLINKIPEYINNPILCSEILYSILDIMQYKFGKFNISDLNTQFSIATTDIIKLNSQFNYDIYTLFQNTFVICKRAKGLRDITNQLVKGKLVELTKQCSMEILTNLLAFKRNTNNFTFKYTYNFTLGEMDWLLSLVNIFNANKNEDIRINFNGLNADFLLENIKRWADEIENNYLKYDQFPQFEHGYVFNNAGLFDGMSGLGYFYLRLYDINLRSPFALSLVSTN